MPYKHLTLEERYAISHLLLIECSYREIGRRLGRSHTTIKREVERNGEKYSRYWYTYTHQTALERRKRANHKGYHSGQVLPFAFSQIPTTLYLSP